MVATAHPTPIETPTQPRRVSDDLPTAISVSGLVKDFGATRAGLVAFRRRNLALPV